MRPAEGVGELEVAGPEGLDTPVLVVDEPVVEPALLRLSHELSVELAA